MVVKAKYTREYNRHIRDARICLSHDLVAARLRATDREWAVMRALQIGLENDELILGSRVLFEDHMAVRVIVRMLLKKLQSLCMPNATLRGD